MQLLINLKVYLHIKDTEEFVATYLFTSHRFVLTFSMHAAYQFHLKNYILVNLWLH